MIDFNGAQQLWKTDGTLTGAFPLHDFLNFNYFYNGNGTYTTLTAIGDTIYFSASDYNNPTGIELWKSDGTRAGTVLIKDINVGSGNSSPSQLTVYNNWLFMSAYDGIETALWKSDGTEGGTVRVKSVQPSAFAVSNNTLFFNGTDTTSGSELWKSDGTTAGTVIIKDIVKGSGNANPANLTDVNGNLFFQAFDSANNTQLWKSNGTKKGTQIVKDIAPHTDNLYLSSFISAAGKLFFLSGNNTIWESDGTSEGTGTIVDETLAGLSTISSLIANGNQLFFNGYNYKYGSELYAGNATQIVLPVSLVTFSASLQDADVIVKWQTSTEINTSDFTVQRSIDAIHFTDAGKVIAKGNSNTLQQYSFPDVNIVNLVTAKNLYYRLETTNKDGSISFSKVVPIDLKWKDVTVLLHPNPAKNVLKVRLNDYLGNTVIELYDTGGKKLHTIQQTIQSGTDVLVNVASLQAGVYLVKVSINGKVLHQKFVKE